MVYLEFTSNKTMDLLPVTLRGFYSSKPLKRPYLDPDSGFKIVVHKPINRSIIENLDNKILLKLTVETIKEAYKP